jgi:uncharacterized membrane protein
MDARHYKYKQDETIQMLDFIIDNIFVLFSGWVFQQMIGFPMGTNCVSLLADSFLYAYGCFESSSVVDIKVKVKVRNRHLGISSVLNSKFIWLDAM